MPPRRLVQGSFSTGSMRQPGELAFGQQEGIASTHGRSSWPPLCVLVAVGMLAVAVVAGAALLRPRGEVHRPAAAGPTRPHPAVSATLTRVQTVPCEEADPGVPTSTCIK